MNFIVFYSAIRHKHIITQSIDNVNTKNSKESMSDMIDFMKKFSGNGYWQNIDIDALENEAEDNDLSYNSHINDDNGTVKIIKSFYNF